MNSTTTLDEARAWLRKRIDHGERCPCCTQFAKVYRRRIHAGMARVLVTMYWRAGTDWVYLPDVPQRSRDATGLAWWGLIEEADEERDDGGRAGWWRVTDLGEQWLGGKVTVPKYARIYDGRCLGHAGERVGIREALGVDFDLSDLMRGGE